MRGEEEEIAKFHEANRQVRVQQQRIFWRISLFTPTSEFLSSLNLAALLGYGGYLTITGQLALGGGLIVFSGLLQQFSSQISKIVNVLNSMQQSLAGAPPRVLKCSTRRSTSNRRRSRSAFRKPRGEIILDNVTYAYAGTKPTLRGVSLKIRAGQRVAVLGATGAGKSTLLHLIPRFLDPGHGRVLLDGADLRSLELSDVRRAIGIVFQETFLFSGTVAENIAFGHPEASRAQIARGRTDRGRRRIHS